MTVQDPAAIRFSIEPETVQVPVVLEVKDTGRFEDAVAVRVTVPPTEPVSVWFHEIV